MKSSCISKHTLMCVSCAVLWFFGSTVSAENLPVSLQLNGDVTSAGSVIESLGARLTLAQSSRFALVSEGSGGAVVYSDRSVDYQLDPELYPDQHLSGQFPADSEKLRAGAYGEAGMSLLYTLAYQKAGKHGLQRRVNAPLLQIGAGAGVFASYFAPTLPYTPTSSEYDRFVQMLETMEGGAEWDYSGDDFVFTRGTRRFPGVLPYVNLSMNLFMSSDWYIEADVKAWSKYGSIGITLGRRLF